MSDEPIAHSARPGEGIHEQSFWEHTNEVTRMAREHADNLLGLHAESSQLGHVIEVAARLHDCGKLAPENQQVLRSASAAKLKIKHEDAGVAWALESGQQAAGLLVYAPHAGLPSLQAEKRKSFEGGQPLRSDLVVAHTTAHLPHYKKLYADACQQTCGPKIDTMLPGLVTRLSLSCLVDADHTDTARHYGSERPARVVRQRWAERLTRLDAFVAALGQQRWSERSRDRVRLYHACRHAPIEPHLRSCEAPVGAGKTTAVMAHLLQVAAARQMRHIFVIVPYTNIIRQSVEVYRQALTLSGEDPEQVVAELHHQADFELLESRSLAALWDAPVIVTTAVQFFETLANNRPGVLRKLHELP